jgi:hypothetical protein
MSVTREVFICSADPLPRLVTALNATLGPARPLKIRTVPSDQGSWEIAEGYADSYPLVLRSTSHLEFDAPGLREVKADGLAWMLSIHCYMRSGEEHESYERRCDEDARLMMVRIGSALGVRCALVGNLQKVLGEYP